MLIGNSLEVRFADSRASSRRGSPRQKFRLRAIPDSEKPPILKAYLDNYKREVQRYFSVPAGSPPEAFVEVASNYPVFELLTN